MKAGAPRYDLNGQVAGEVTAEQAHAAAKNVERKMAREAARKAARKAAAAELAKPRRIGLGDLKAAALARRNAA